MSMNISFFKKRLDDHGVISLLLVGKFLFLLLLFPTPGMAAPHAQPKEFPDHVIGGNSHTETPRRIIVGDDQYFPPYAFLENGEPRGFNIDIMKAAAQAVGIEVEFRLGPWTTVRRSLENGKIDAISGMYYSRERDRVVDFTIPHSVSTYDVFVRKDSNIFKLADIRGKDILVQESDIMHDYMEANTLAGRLFTVKDAPDSLNLLVSGKYDGALLPRMQGSFLMDKFGLDNIRPIGAKILPQNYCIAVREGDTVLRSQLSEGLNIIKTTGRYQDIYDTWFGISPKKAALRTMEQHAWVGAIILAVLTGMVTWFVSLKKQVQKRTRELVRANNELRDSEEKNRAILNALPDLMFLNSREGVFLECHTAVPELLMMPPEQFIGKEFHDVLPQDLADRFTDNFAKSFATGKNAIFEYCTEVNGRPHHFEAHVAAYENDKVLTIVRDISERKEMARTVQESEEKYRQLVESSNSAILRIDDKGNVTFFNDFAQKFFGYREEEILGRNLVGTIVPEVESTGRDLKSMIDDILLNPGRYLSNINENMRRSGERVWVLWANRPVMDEKGNLKETLCIGNDITDLRRAEEALQASEERYRIFTGITSDYVFKCSRKSANPYRIEWMAGAVEAITGYSPEEILKMGTWLKIVHPDDAESVASRLLKTFPGLRDSSKFRIVTKSGDIRWIKQSCTCEAGTAPDELLLYGTYQDITEQEMLQKQVLKNQKLESLGLLAGGIAHDFNNIITGIMGNTSFARMFLDPSHKSYTALEAAEKASLRAAELARQLLTFARGGEPVKGVVAVGDIVRESVSLALRGTKVKESIQIPDSLHAVNADSGQIAQAFNNIAINAVQAMPGGGMLRVLTENITLGAGNRQFLPAGDYVRIIFSDEGCGIADEDIPKIFDPYFTTKPKGWGLGLSSVFSIVNKHGGSIEVHSEVNKGTRFTVYLPSLGKTVHEQTGDNLPPIYSSRGESILLMDDEDMIRSLAEDMLGHLGFRVTTCDDGEEAVRLYRNSMESGTKFTAVIMDLTIPGGMGGEEAARRILALDPEARLIVSSGYSHNPVMSDYRNYGFLGALNKPYRIDELARMLVSLPKP